ncbi:MAG TPA: aminotransferase class I/II-fold pyridoxal phosphate-dependent enzyme, partial [Rhodospirillales bacterium]|nr:aminotransferase class I/II-fold pyridoxal phosphate-dependent enzyme [Rhodospirillales bacterium]
CVVSAPGTQAIIQILPRLRPTGAKVCVLGPTYAEHEACWRAGGHRVEAVSQIDRLADPWDVVVVVNPNNPDGRVLKPDFLLGLAGQLARRGGLLIVDEAFADTAPETSLSAHADHPGLIVLRSFGKFFGLAGLRLGFALAAPGEIRRLTRALGPWAVGGPALALGARALKDKAWIDETREKLAKAGESLRELLNDRGLKDLGGTSLFHLAGHEKAQNLFESLGRAGILVRPFAEAPDRLRFGLPASKKDEARLAAALGGL